MNGHTKEIVCSSFDPDSLMVATGSMDHTVKLWDIETGRELFNLAEHKAEIVTLNFNYDGDKLITASFDNTAKIWDVWSGKCLFTLEGHTGELSCGQFIFTGDFCLTGSMDRTCKLWDVGSGQCIETLKQNDEVLDACFNRTASKLAVASAEGVARIYNFFTGACISVLKGHENEISRISFNP